MTKKELAAKIDMLPDLDLNQRVLDGMATVKRIVTDMSFVVNHEHFKQDFACRRIAENEDISQWVGL